MTGAAGLMGAVGSGGGMGGAFEGVGGLRGGGPHVDCDHYAASVCTSDSNYQDFDERGGERGRGTCSASGKATGRGVPYVPSGVGSARGVTTSMSVPPPVTPRPGPVAAARPSPPPEPPPPAPLAVAAVTPTPSVPPRPRARLRPPPYPSLGVAAGW